MQLARRAGIVGASPLVVAAAAWLAALLGVELTARSAAAQLAVWIEDACTGSAASLTLPRLAGAVLALAAPMIAAAALAAIVAHVVQTRSVWLPRRRILGAPTLPADAAARARGTAFTLVAALGLAAATLIWLWTVAPRLGTLLAIDDAGRLVAGAAFIAGFATTLALGWVVLGVVDAVARWVQLAAALRMSATEKREDDRLAGADPRWRQARASAARRSHPRADDDIGDAVRGASLVIRGEGIAAAISWHAVLRPIPTRLVAGRGARATQLLALARHHGVAIHTDTALAVSLAADADGPIAPAHWHRLAGVVAAVQRGTRGRR